MSNIIKNHPVICTVAVIFLCFLPLMATRDFTFMNELRYLEITDEALADGTFFTLTNNGVPYSDKPPLFFWLMMISKAIAGKHSIFLLSLLSFIPAMVTIAVMDKWLRVGAAETGRKASATVRAATALTLATTGLFAGTSVFVRMDQMMVMFIVLSLYSFYRMFTESENSRLHSWLFPVFIFLALLSKGPVGLLAPIVSVLCFLLITGKGKSAGKYLGWKTFGVIAGLAALWFLGIILEGGTAYLYDLTVHQTFGRAFNAFHHKRPFYFYLYAILVVMLPYVLITLPTFVKSAFKNKEGRSRSGTETLFLCAVCGTFIMLSLFSSKLHLYLLPLIPFITYCFALETLRSGWKKWMSVGLLVTLVVFILAGGAGLAALTAGKNTNVVLELAEKYPFIESALSVFACIVLLAGSLMGLVSELKKKNHFITMIILPISMLLAVCSVSLEMKEINPYIGYGTLCAAVPTDAEVCTMYLKRPENMSVYLGRGVTDFKKDTDMFLDEMNKESRTITVLLVDSEKLDTDAELSEYVRKNAESITAIGPCSMIQF